MWSLQVRNILSYLFLVILFQPPDHGAQNDWTNKSQAKFNETRKSQWVVIVSESDFLFLCTFVLGRNLFQFSYFQSTSELISAHCVKLNGWVGLFVFSFTWESRCKNHKYFFLIATALPMKTKEKKSWWTKAHNRPFNLHPEKWFEGSTVKSTQIFIG